MGDWLRGGHGGGGGGLEGDLWGEGGRARGRLVVLTATSGEGPTEVALSPPDYIRQPPGDVWCMCVMNGVHFEWCFTAILHLHVCECARSHTF